MFNFRLLIRNPLGIIGRHVKSKEESKTGNEVSIKTKLRQKGDSVTDILNRPQAEPNLPTKEAYIREHSAYIMHTALLALPCSVKRAREH